MSDKISISVQFVDEGPFDYAHQLGEVDTLKEAVDIAFSLMDDTVDLFILRRGDEMGILFNRPKE